MQLRPNPIGPKALYLNPATTELTSTILAAIDGTISENTLYPYAYSSSVSDTTDAREYHFGLTGGSDLVSGMRVAFGLFLTPQNDKGNCLFQVSGRAFIHSIDNTGCDGVRGAFFFGRKASNNTVTQSDAAPANQMDRFTVLPLESAAYVNSSLPTSMIDQSICKEVFAQYSSAYPYTYCFGYYLENYHASTATLRGRVSLSIRKFTDDIGVYAPSRS